MNAALKDFGIEAVARGFTAHVQNPDNGQYFPKPADIVKIISGTTRDKSFVAWTKVDKAVRMIGSNQSVVFDDLLINKVIDDMGGWIALGEKSEREWPFIAKDFQERYRGYGEKRELPNGCPRKLIGAHEAENERLGFDIAPPVLIGDQSVAKNILLSAPGKPALEMKVAKLVDMTISEKAK